MRLMILQQTLSRMKRTFEAEEEDNATPSHKLMKHHHMVNNLPNVVIDDVYPTNLLGSNILLKKEITSKEDVFNVMNAINSLVDGVVDRDDEYVIDCILNTMELVENLSAVDKAIRKCLIQSLAKVATFNNMAKEGSCVLSNRVATLLFKLLHDKKPLIRATSAQVLGEIIQASSLEAVEQVESILVEHLLHLLPTYEGTPHSIGYAIEQVVGRSEAYSEGSKWTVLIKRVMDIVRIISYSSKEVLVDKNIINSLRCSIEMMGGIMIASRNRSSSCAFQVESLVLEELCLYSSPLHSNELVRMSLIEVLGKASSGNFTIALNMLLNILSVEESYVVKHKAVESLVNITLLAKATTTLTMQDSQRIDTILHAMLKDDKKLQPIVQRAIKKLKIKF